MAARRIRQTPSPEQHLSVLAYGAEPIGAAAQGAIDRVIGSRMSGQVVLVAAGLRGYDDANTSVFQTPQLFPGAVSLPVISPGTAAAPAGDSDVPSSVLPPDW